MKMLLQRARRRFTNKLWQRKDNKLRQTWISMKSTRIEREVRNDMFNNCLLALHYLLWLEATSITCWMEIVVQNASFRWFRPRLPRCKAYRSHKDIIVVDCYLHKHPESITKACAKGSIGGNCYASHKPSQSSMSHVRFKYCFGKFKKQFISRLMIVAADMVH